MKKILFLLFLGFISCKSNEKEPQRKTISQVVVEPVLEDSLSIRAIELMGNTVAFAGSEGHFGVYIPSQDKLNRNRQEYDSIFPEFRAVASTANDFFMLSVGNPALLFKTGEQGEMELVYTESHEEVFYDSMDFWNDQEGIAMGDPIDGCLSIIITRDGGKTWKKLSCDDLPAVVDGEAAFAASDSNIAIAGDKTWIVTGGMESRVFFSPDKGKTWEVFELPIISGEATTGAYSADFYDENIGIVIGGDYTAPDGNTANKAVTNDGGKTWALVADGQDPGYKSSVRYVPGGEGKEIFALGFTGISYSSDGGESWKKLSDEGFYTIRFMNDSTAYAAGKHRLAKLKFKREGSLLP